MHNLSIYTCWTRLCSFPGLQKLPKRELRIVYNCIKTITASMHVYKLFFFSYIYGISCLFYKIAPPPSNISLCLQQSKCRVWLEPLPSGSWQGRLASYQLPIMLPHSPTLMRPLPELEGSQAAAATSGPHSVLLQGNVRAAHAAASVEPPDATQHRNKTKPADLGFPQQN